MVVVGVAVEMVVLVAVAVDSTADLFPVIYNAVHSTVVRVDSVRAMGPQYSVRAMGPQ